MKYFLLIITLVILLTSCSRTTKKAEQNSGVIQDTIKPEVLGFFDSTIDLKGSIDYSVLSTLAYFSYEVNPHTGEPENGGPSSIVSWDNNHIIDTAKKRGVKILLTVTILESENNTIFLSNPKAQNKLIENLKTFLHNRADGICIDFEGINMSEKTKFSNFIKKTRNSLKAENSKYQIYITTPAVDPGYLDFKTLIPSVDQFVIMGYDYNSTHGNLNAGSTDPLNVTSKFPPYSLSKSVDDYLKKVPPSKLILALPYYGLEWNTKNSEVYSEGEFKGTIRYDHIVKRKRPQDVLKYDTISQSAWFFQRSPAGSDFEFNQYWFDNDSTLAIKLRYIRDKKLNGMGIWELGYAVDYPQRWQVISKNLKYTEQKKNKEIGWILAKLKTLESILVQITKYKSVLLYTLSFAVFFGGLGFLIAMFSPNTRTYFFSNTAYRIYYSIGILLFLLVILYIMKIILTPSVFLILGFLIGGTTMFFVSKLIEKIHKNLP